MIERIARILCASAGNPPGAVNATPAMCVPEGDVDWQRFEPTAREMLIEMGDPTEEMRSAGCQAEDIDGSIGEIWTSMVDAALGEDAI